MIARFGWTFALSCVVAANGVAQETAIAPAPDQIAAAVLPLPADARASATVLGYGADGKLTMLRKGSGAMTCLADDPKLAQFHVACYHDSLEPFMARGRELRASGVTGTQVDTVRFREAKSGNAQAPESPGQPVFTYRRNVRSEDRNCYRGAAPLCGLHPVCDRSVDWIERQTAGQRTLDHVRRDAESAHHVRSEDVRQPWRLADCGRQTELTQQISRSLPSP